MSEELVDMAMTPEEVKESYGLGPVVADKAEDKGPQYPYGLCLSLCERELEKLGITKLPEVGDVAKFDIAVKVTSVSQDANENRESQRVSLQITHMGQEEEEEQPSVSSMLYDHGKGEE